MMNGSNCNWLPVVLQPWYLLLISLLCVGLAVGMECTYRHYDRKDDSSLFSFHDDLSDLSLGQYFIWRILLSLIILSWGGLIASINYQLMRMAPFRQLGRREGMSGRDALLRNPGSLWTYARNPKKAGRLVWLCFSNVLLANVIAPIVQSTVFLSTNPPDTSLTGEAYTKAAAQRISQVVIRPTSSRALSVIFVLVAVSCLSLIFILRPGLGLRQDPGGVSGAASLLIGSNVRAIEDFESDQIKLQNGTLRVPDSHRHQLTESSVAHSIYSIPLLSSTIVFGVFLCIFCGISTYTNAVWTLRRIPWLIVAFAILYQQLWTQCETSFRVTEPFRQLSRGAAPPLNLFVDYTGVPTICLPFLTLKNKHWVLSVSAIASNLIQLLVISATCLGDISSYIFVSSTTHQGAPGDYASQYTEVTNAGNASLRLFLYVLWIYMMVLLALLSIWLGCMIGIGVSHNYWHPIPDDPVKLGVLLGWVVGTDLLEIFTQMHRGNKAITLKEFVELDGGNKWTLVERESGGIFKFERYSQTREMCVCRGCSAQDW